MNVKEARAYLDSFENYEFRLHAIKPNAFTLERIKYLLNLIGNPQDNLKIIHIAGSKGKGSTSIMIAHILKEAGYKVGLYTSPHIKNCRERIRILDKQKPYKKSAFIFPDMISRVERAKIVTEIKPAIEKTLQQKELEPLTWFEIYTTIAFQYFYEKEVDAVVLETGLGGRLDATNVGKSLISVITPISHEHTDILGKKIEEIATEKAAIIKNSKTLAVIAPQNKEALDTIIKHCNKIKAQYLEVFKEINIKFGKHDLRKQNISIDTKKNKYSNVQLALLGQHQGINAATAVVAAEALNEKGFTIAKKHIINGLKNISWPLRFEIVRTNPTIILDCAHSPAAAKAVVKTFQEYFPKINSKIIIGFSKDKDIKTICQEINKIAKAIIFTKANNRRAADLSMEKLRRYFNKQPVFKTDHVKAAIKLAAKNLTKDDILLITGSNFIASEARELCINLKI